MKKTIFFLSTILLVGYTSCSSDDDSNPNPTSDILVKKVIYQQEDEDGINYEITFTYNGNKLDQGVHDDGTIEKYFYTGDLITKIDYTLDGEEGTDFFTYDSQDRLIEAKLQLKFDDGAELEEKFLFEYNDDNTINQTYISGPWNNSLTTGDESIITVLDDEFKTVAQQSFFGSTYTYTYDNKNSPFKNVTGYAKIAYAFKGDFELEGRNHNILRIYNETRAANYTVNTITYNADDYPTTIVSQAWFQLDVNDFSETMTIQYIYE